MTNLEIFKEFMTIKLDSVKDHWMFSGFIDDEALSLALKDCFGDTVEAKEMYFSREVRQMYGDLIRQRVDKWIGRFVNKTNGFGLESEWY